jgi:hypothetical protein
MLHPGLRSIPLALAACAVLGGSGARAAEPEPGVSHAEATALAKRFSAEIDCARDSRDVQRAWCAVHAVPTSSYTAPKDPQTLLGISMELRPEGPVGAALLATTSLSVIHLQPGGVRMHALTPSNEEEKTELGGVVMELAFVLKGKANEVRVTGGLDGFLQSEAKKPVYPVGKSADGAGYLGKLPSRIYRIGGQPYGEGLVVFERAPSGWFVSVFPGVPRRATPPPK